MLEIHLKKILQTLVLFVLLTSCSFPIRSNTNQSLPSTLEVIQGSTSISPANPAITPTLLPAAPRQLRICMAEEPRSLFLYGDSSQAARNIRQAIYDGPFDILNFVPSAVILDEMPSQANGGVYFESVQVLPGESIVDAKGVLINLTEGVEFLPSGCRSVNCAAAFSGNEAVQMDQMVLQFLLRA